MAGQKSKKVLQDHKRVGKRFIPPFVQEFKMEELSYVNLVFPHVLWMGMLNDNFGYRTGVNLSIALTKTAHAAHRSEKHVNFALCGSYSMLLPESKSEILRVCEKQGVLKDIQRALAPIIVHYDGFPMSFLGIGDISTEPQILLMELKRAIQRSINKYETPGLVLQANLIVAQAATGGLYISENIKLPDFDSIIAQPDSEEAKHAGAFVRASSFAMFLPNDISLYEAWSRQFWNQGYKIEPCFFSGDE
ncbi:MAG: hypothetical protein AB7G68_00990 [Nitrospiraceae bacterium]